MRKIFFLAILLLGLLPYIDSGSLRLMTGSAMAQSMGEENDYEDYDEWWDMSEDEFSDLLYDDDFFEEFEEIFSDDLLDWLDDDFDYFSDGEDWTWLDELSDFATVNEDDGIDWQWLEAVTVTSSSSSNYNTDDYDWTFLQNMMLYYDQPEIVGYSPDYYDPNYDPNSSSQNTEEDKPKPKYFKPNVKLWMRTQKGQMSCVPATMSYLNNQLCGGNKTEDDYINNYENSHSGWDVEADGIPTNQMAAYVAANFNTVPYSGYLIALLDAGFPVLTTISKYDDSNNLYYHSVVMIGYDTESDVNNRTIYYMDPATGRQDHMKHNTWNTGSMAAYAYPITGCK